MPALVPPAGFFRTDFRKFFPLLRRVLENDRFFLLKHKPTWTVGDGTTCQVIYGKRKVIINFATPSCSFRRPARQADRLHFGMRQVIGRRRTWMWYTTITLAAAVVLLAAIS